MHVHWYAVQTRSRHEKIVAQGLGEKGVEVFLPQVDRLRRWKDRQKRVAFPLFPGYLFTRQPGRAEDRLAVLRTVGVVRFVGYEAGVPIPVPDEQVEAVRRMLESELKVDPYPYLKVGIRVRVVEGPLKGVEGILIEKPGEHRLVVGIDILQRAVSVTIPVYQVAAA